MVPVKITEISGWSSYSEDAQVLVGKVGEILGSIQNLKDGFKYAWIHFREEINITGDGPTHDVQIHGVKYVVATFDDLVLAGYDPKELVRQSKEYLDDLGGKCTHQRITAEKGIRIPGWE